MAGIKITPQEQKAKLLGQKKELEKKLAEFDARRAAAIGAMAKRFKLTDLPDEALEAEFKMLQEKYKTSPENAAAMGSVEHKDKKK